VTIQLELLDRDGSHIRWLDGWVEGTAGWSHPRRGVGGGTVTIPNDHDDFADLTEPDGFFRCIRCYLNPPASPVAADAQFLWVINRAPRTRLSAQGQQDEVTQISGDGGLSLLGTGQFHSAIVVADSGIRTFGWVAPDWDESGWTAAVSSGTQANPDVDTLVGAPEGWPDPDAEWIWSRALVSGSHPDGTVYLRGTWDPGSFTGTVRVYWTADNGADLYVDGDLRGAEGDNRYFWRESDSFLLDVDGEVTFAAKVTNDVPTLGDNPGGLLLTVMTVDERGDPVDVLFRSDETWVALDYTEPEGVTYGHVMGRLIDEAQARGCLPGVTYAFTDALDSDGNAWDVSLPIVAYRDGVQVGDVCLQGTQQFKAGCQMLPTLELQLLNTLGSDLSASVQLAENDPDPAVNDVVSSTVDVSAPKATVARVETERGFGWEVDGVQVAEFGRRETAATYGMSRTVDEVANAAEALLDDLRGVVVQVLNVPSDTAYGVFSVGDIVGVRETVGGVFEPYRVELISPTEVEGGNVEVDVDVERRL
jgi:hypothetical protein